MQLLVVLSVALLGCLGGLLASSGECDSVGCAPKRPIDETTQGKVVEISHHQYADPMHHEDLCSFARMRMSQDMLLRVLCSLQQGGYNHRASSIPLRPQGSIGSRVKRQLSGATSVATSQGIVYPHPFMGGYGYGYGYPYMFG